MAETVLAGRYRLLAEIGQGDRTVTYKALDTSLNRTVVAKILRERYAVQQESVDRFQRAAQAIAGLSHPHIVAVHDIGSDKGLHYLVTEYVEGQSLDSLLTSSTRLTTKQSLNIAIPVCTALDAAHRAGFVHGQLNPRNILLTEGQEVKVSDFSAVDIRAPIPPAVKSPSRYAALYLSPEQVMGRRSTAGSDVYAVGVILYEMLAGRPPFQGDSSAEVAEKHIREDPEPLHVANPQVPRSLSALVHRGLAKRSTARYRTASAFERALTDYLRKSEAIGVAERISAEEQRKARRRRLAEEKRPSTVVVHDQAPDWVAILMGMAALVAVLGLIPLWLIVFLRYSG